MVTYDVFIDAAHAAMPSSYFESLTIPDSNDDYVEAPADGYIAGTGSSLTGYDIGRVQFFKKMPDAEGYYWYDYRFNSSLGYMVSPWLPVSKGEKIYISRIYCQLNNLYFIYANGSVSATSNP